MPDNLIVAITNVIEESPAPERQCQLMAGEGDFRDSATENKPPNQGSERRGKSSPVLVTKTHGKPTGSKVK